MSDNDQYISLSPLKITIIYLIIAALWIAFTDRLLESYVSDSSALSILQTYKGWFYVAMTSLGLYYLIKRNEDQIKEKENQLRSLVQDLKSEKELSDILFERIPILITIYDPDLEKFEVNNEFEKVIGWSNEEIEEKDIHLLKTCYPDLDTQEKVIEFMNNPGVGWKEFIMTTKTGDKIPTSWTNIRLTDNTSVGIGIDMTDIKASQAKVRQSQELLKKTFESLQSSIIVLDMDTRTIVECNKSTEELFGYSREELIGSSTRKLHESAAKFMLFDELSKKELLKTGTFETEFTMQRKDGSIFYSDHTVSLVRDEANKTEKVVSVIRNIDEQKKYQRQLEQHNEFIKTTFNNLPIGVVTTNIDSGEITLINEPYSDIHGWPTEVLKDEDTFYEKVFPDQEYREKVRTQIEKDINSHDPERMQWDGLKIRTQEGEKRIVNVKNIPLYDQNVMISAVEDVTQQKKLEKELRKRQERLLRSQKIGQIGDWELNPKTNEISWSPTMFEIYERDPQLGPPTYDEIQNNYYGSSLIKHNEAIEGAIEKKESYDIDLELKTDKGNKKFVRAIIVPKEDKEGEVIKLLGVVQDITERKISQKKLEQRNTFIETTIQNLPIGVAVNTIDDGKVTIINKQFADIYGWPEDILKDVDSFFEHVYSDDELRQRIRNQVTQDMESGQPERMNWKGIPITTQDGEERFVNNKAIPLYDQNLMISTVIDVTEQKKLEQKLRESENKYRHLFEKNPEPMWIYNPESLQLVEVNDAAIEHYGYSEEEFLNMTLLDIHPDEDAKALKQNVKENAGSKSYSEEWVHLKKDGTEITVELSAVDVRYGNNKTYRLVLINDVTEQKKMQEKIIQSVIEAENRERKRIAHELHDGLGQYLVAANMNLQSVHNNSDPLSPKRLNQLETGISLLKNALSETRSIAHNLMPKAISDYGLIAAIENLVKDLQKSSDVAILFNHNCDDLDLKNQAEINIYRITQEILSNAIRHANCSSIDIKLQLKQDTLTLIVKDDGIGMELEETYQDEGLGLQSIKTRVSNLRGSLDIDSEPGVGIETTITIPNMDNLKPDNSPNG